ncbi:hypothetical protein [Leptospira weilii]
MLNDKVVPWFQEDGVWLLRILTDEKPSIVEIESTMNSNCSLLWKIGHLKTKARYSQPNGICERFHRTIQDEFYAIAFRKKVYNSIEDLQKDLD